MGEYKQVILVRNDLKLPKGKLSAQVAHASVEAVLRSDAKMISKWRSTGMAKIVLKVDDLKELRKYEKFAKEIGLVTAVISDAGKTVVAPGTVTCMAIGPSIESEIDKVTNELKLL